MREMVAVASTVARSGADEIRGRSLGLARANKNVGQACMRRDLFV